MEFPYMQAIAQEMASQGVVVMGVDAAPLNRAFDSGTALGDLTELELASRVMRYNRAAPMMILLDPGRQIDIIKKRGLEASYSSAAIVGPDRKVLWTGSAKDISEIRRVLEELVSDG